MKTAIKLVLIYFLMQILGALTAVPLAVLYVFLTTGSLDATMAQSVAMAPTLLLGMVYMAAYLWKKGYLANDGQIYSFTTPVCLSWCLLAGIAGMTLTNAIVSQLTFLPDLMKQTFDVLQSGWLGIFCIAVAGPVLEELLFRGAITKALLKKYSPATAIVLSGLVFGVFHINPVQVVSAALIGFLLAWLYYRTRSLMACILIHIVNNSFSVWLSLNYPDAETTADLPGMGSPAVQIACVVAAAALLAVSVWRIRQTTQVYSPANQMES